MAWNFKEFSMASVSLVHGLTELLFEMNISIPTYMKEVNEFKAKFTVQ